MIHWFGYKNDQKEIKVPVPGIRPIHGSGCSFFNQIKKDVHESHGLLGEPVREYLSLEILKFLNLYLTTPVPSLTCTCQLLRKNSDESICIWLIVGNEKLFSDMLML